MVKVILRYRAPFWDAGPWPDTSRWRLARVGFLQTSGPTFPTWWTAYPIGAPVITGWAAGPAAEALVGTDKADLIERAVDEIGQVFGARRQLRAQLESAYVHDWQTDAYARGSYSYIGVGGMAAQTTLRRPVDSTLFFAGEALENHGYHAMVHGALATGQRAADLVLATLGLAASPRPRRARGLALSGAVS